jgi:hypothetical protein
MKYVNLKDYSGKLAENEILLMSHDEFEEGGKEIMNIPICVTSNGNEPVLIDEMIEQ